MASLLDLVALGTVADLVPLDLNNRILVQQGLLRMRARQTRPGLLALMQVAGRDPSRLMAADLGFALGPRLNAAGRMEDMSIGIECLLAADAEQAMHYASQLDEINQRRREKQTQMQDEAIQLVERLLPEEGALPLGICVYKPHWHEGIVGLVAAKLKERHHRPAIAFAQAGDGSLKGSARSIPGLHIRDILDELATANPGLVTKFGGHAMAAGLSLAESDLERFSAAFESTLSRHLEPDMLQDIHHSDGEIRPADLNLSQAAALEQAGPWGQGFPEPLFHGRFELVDLRVLKDRHLKLRVKPVYPRQEGEPAMPLEAIAFNVVEDGRPLPSGAVEFTYRLAVNEYRGQQSCQLVIERFC